MTIRLGEFVLVERKGADQEMTRTVSGYWANFVRTGDPNGAGLPDWPRYDPAAGNVLDFADTGVESGPDPLRPGSTCGSRCGSHPADAPAWQHVCPDMGEPAAVARPARFINDHLNP